MQSKFILKEVSFLRETKRYLIEEQKQFKRKIRYFKDRIRNIDNHLYLNSEEDTQTAEIKEFLYKEIEDTKQSITKNIQEIENTEKQKLRMYAELKRLNNNKYIGA